MAMLQKMAISLGCALCFLAPYAQQSRCEYWLDNDYNTRATVPSDLSSALNLNVPLGDASAGMHFFNLRAIDADGNTGNLLRTPIFVLPQENPSIGQPSGYEYWIDNDYAAHTYVTGSSQSVKIVLDIANLNTGMHQFNFRGFGQDNAVGNLLRTHFFVLPTFDPGLTLPQGYEYWLDNDYASKQYVADTSDKVAITLDTSNLNSGMHMLNFRAIGQSGSVGNLLRTAFYVLQSAEPEDAEVSYYEAWFDSDYDNHIVQEALDHDLALDLDVSQLSGGMHFFNLRAVSPNGTFGNLKRTMFYLTPQLGAEVYAYEYWIDEQEPIRVNERVREISLAIDVSDLELSEHTFNIHAMNQYESWGPAYTYTFDTYPAEQMSDEEWEALKLLAAELADMGWTVPWGFASGKDAAKDFEGVTVYHQHVTGFDFSAKGLTGIMPMSMSLFPYLTLINLSGNNLSGDLPSTMSETCSLNPLAFALVNTVIINHNDFDGNLGILGSALPSLTTLDASYNGFADIAPQLPTRIKSLDYSHQTIDKTIEWDLSNADGSVLMAQIPTIILYDHSNQTYSTEANILCSAVDIEDYDRNNPEQWALQVKYSDGELSMPYVSAQNVYYGNTGDMLNAFALDNKNATTGDTFHLTLYFPEGDANFNGAVDVLDLQSEINFMFDDYNSRPFNFTAANLWDDDIINVQDAACLINILLEQTTPQLAPIKISRIADLAGEAALCVVGSQLMINANTPVAAFDIMIVNATDIELAPELAQAGFVITKQGTHIVGYSLSGATISGSMCLGTVDGLNPYVGNAMLASLDAYEIPTMLNDPSSLGITVVPIDQVSQYDSIYSLSGVPVAKGNVRAATVYIATNAMGATKVIFIP